MNGNGSLLRPKNDASDAISKSAADVQFTTTSHSSSTPGVASHHVESTSDHKGKRPSAGEKIKSRLSLRPRQSLIHKSKEHKDGADTSRAPSTSTRSVNSIENASSPNESSTPARSISSEVRAGSSLAAQETDSLDKRLSALRTPDGQRKTSSMSSTKTDSIGQSAVSPELDPARLVQMALNLSESRRRHASLPLQFPSSADGQPSSRAVQPHPDSQHSSPLPKISLDNSYNASPSSPRQARLSRDGTKGSPLAGLSELQDAHSSFSPATLVRAERARRHFELASQHRRLLDIARAAPAQMGIDSSATQYNPLRALRDRRAREGASTTTPYDAGMFQDVTTVGDWVDQVEAAAKHGTSSPAEQMTIPAIAASDSAAFTSTIGHRRGGTADTIVHKPASAWSISPSELLLDTYMALHHDLPSVAEDTQAADQSRKPLAKHGHLSLHHHRRRDTTDQEEPENVRKKFLPLKAADRLRGSRLNRLTRSDSASSASSVEAANRALFDPTLRNVNVGPLRKHMNELLEASERDTISRDQPASPDHWGMVQAQQYAARQRAASRASAIQPVEPFNRAVVNNKTGQDGSRGNSSSDVSHHASPHQSIGNASTSPANGGISGHHSKTGNVRRLAHLSSSKNKPSSDQQLNVIRVDSQPSTVSREQESKIDPSRLSVESARPTFFKRHKTTDSFASAQSGSRSAVDRDADSTEPRSALTRQRFGGRIVDIMRTESSKFGDKVRPKKMKGDTSDVSAHASDVSDAENVLDSASSSKAGLSEVPTRTSLERTTSRSRFHIPALPSFKAITPREPQLLSPITSHDSGDHISRQQAANRLRNKSPRFQRLAPPPLVASYTRSSDSTQGFVSPIEHDDSSAERLSVTLEHPAEEHSPSKQETEHADPASGPSPEHDSGSGTVQMRDIARVRAVILASGIKAQTLAERLQTPAPTSSILPAKTIDACQLQISTLTGKPRIEQTPVAVQLLCAYLDSGIQSMHQEAQAYQAKQLQALVAKQEMLKTRVREDLAELVHGTADQADAFNVELSTQATMRTKQVDDAVEDVLRLRRRQFRLVRVALFKLLEWLVLSILWCVWFTVVCFKTARTTLVTIFRILRWLVTF